MGPVTLREAGLDEAETILGLMQAAFAEYEGVLDPPSGARTETAETVRHRLLKGGAVLADAGGEPAGFAFFELQDGLLYLGRLSVPPTFRNKGIGSKLLEYVEERARTSGAAGVRLGVRLQLPHLIARYERKGYRVTKYMTHAGYAQPTFVFMEKRF